MQHEQRSYPTPATQFQQQRAQAARHLTASRTSHYFVVAAVEAAAAPQDSVDLANYPSSASLHAPFIDADYTDEDLLHHYSHTHHNQPHLDTMTGEHEDAFAHENEYAAGPSGVPQQQQQQRPQRAGRFTAARENLLQPVIAPARVWYDEMRWSRGKPATPGRRRIQLFASYAPDWIITLVLAGLLALVNDVHGFRREFSLTDTSLQHTHALKERVTVPELGVYAVLIPIIFIAIFSLGINRSVWDFHAGLLGLILTHALTVTATTLIKVAVGRPRPDIIDRCQPRAGSMNASPYGLVTDAICTADINGHVVTDGFRSFPSGHASTAFAGLTFLSLFLAGKLHLMNRKGHAGTAWVVFFPLVGATLIAVSRTMDYRHHATDVIAGGLLGFSIASVTYRQYYPPLAHPTSHKPWAPRIPRLDASTSEESYDIEGQRHSYAPATNPGHAGVHAQHHEDAGGMGYEDVRSPEHEEMARQTVPRPQQ